MRQCHAGQETKQFHTKHFHITVEAVALRYSDTSLCTQTRHTPHHPIHAMPCRKIKNAEYPGRWAAHMPTLKMLQGSTLQCPHVTFTVCHSHLKSAQVTCYPVMLQLYTCLCGLRSAFRLLQSWESESKPHAADCCFALTATLHCCT